MPITNPCHRYVFVGLKVHGDWWCCEGFVVAAWCKLQSGTQTGINKTGSDATQDRTHSVDKNEVE